MADTPSSGLLEGFRQACSLPPAAREPFLLRLEREDPALGRELRALLEADSRDENAALERGLPTSVVLRAMAPVDAGAIRAELDRLRSWTTNEDRFELRGAIGSGSMGQVSGVWDAALRRMVARKSLRSGRTGGQVTAWELHRFLSEARVTGRLEHPGIVPVHDVGVDGSGTPFFTMQRVQGQDLQQVYQLEREAAGGWTRTRVLGVLMRVCEAMAYAHSQGVVHRDLKPANIMVGAFGEVYVMDWGVARVREAATPPEAAVDELGGSGLRTASGTIIGTPHYMSPEQAAGNADDVDERSDVYAVGAMLYELLAHRRPWGDAQSAHALLERITRENPPPLRVRGLPADLVSICAKAMCRDRLQRYPDMRAFAADLRAFLEDRVVRAHERGALAELRKWVRRNRLPATAAGVAHAALVIGTVLTKASERFAADKVREFDQLKGVVLLADLRSRAAALGPPWPIQIPALASWVCDCDQLLGMRSEIERTLADLGAIDTAAAADAAPPLDEARQFLRNTLGELSGGLLELGRRQRPVVEQHLLWARRIEQLTRAHPQARVTWDAVRTVLRSSEHYRGLGIELGEGEVLGLVPIGANPATGLLEFYHLRSAWDGECDPAALQIPIHRADGSIAVEDGTGIVFVLLAGGTFVMGAQSRDPAAPGFDPLAEADEAAHRVSLAPFFLAKHEVTKGQWSRLSGAVHAGWCRPGASLDGDPPIGPAHPAEDMDWFAGQALAQRFGLLLPTEAQWEYACRAGTTTAWNTGSDPRDLARVANVLDLRGEASHPGWGRQSGDFDDGYTWLAPVGSYAPNAFGLHDMHGNAWEWCSDGYRPYPGLERSADGGLLSGRTTMERVYRGGGFNAPAGGARCAYRGHHEATLRNVYLGLRLARAVRPGT